MLLVVVYICIDLEVICNRRFLYLNFSTNYSLWSNLLYLGFSTNYSLWLYLLYLSFSSHLLI